MKHMHKNPVFARAQHGFTIVEALVTFLILSVGLLGMAGLQTKGLQMDQNAYQRSQVAMLAQDIADRMRVNRDKVREDAYVISFGDDAQTDDNCVTSTCSSSAMAQYDLHQWKTALARMLPAGDGKIDTVDSETAAPAKDVTITIHWDEFRTGATGTNCPPVSEADMACFEFRVTL